MKPDGGFRCDVPSLDLLTRLAGEPLPHGLRAGRESKTYFRDVYFDTADGSLERRGLTCRFRYLVDDRRVLTIALGGRGQGAVVTPAQAVEAPVAEPDAATAFAGGSEPARRLRALVDPARLEPVADLETERIVRVASGRWPSRPRFELAYDAVTVAARGMSGRFQELVIRRLRPGAPRLETLAQSLLDAHGLRPVLVDRLDRAQQLMRALETDALARHVQPGRAVAVLALDEGRVALLADGGALRLPVLEGSGEAASRRLLRSTFGHATAQLAPLGTVPGGTSRPALEVWLALRVAVEAPPGGAVIEWLALDDVVARVGSPALRDPLTLSALTLAARSDLVSQALAGAAPAAARQRARWPGRAAPAPPAAGAPEQYLNPELSALEFNARVLALAEDRALPLLERVRFLSIFASNLDELFVVRVAALKQAAAEQADRAGPDGLTPAAQLDLVAVRVRQLAARQARCLAECLPALAAQGILIRPWAELDETQRASATDYFERQVLPLLSPRAMTQAPGHPFPQLRSLALSLAVMVRDPRTGPYHFVYLRVPAGTSRFVPLAGGSVLVPVEDVIRANLARLYPAWQVEHVATFRVTRGGDVQVDERAAADLLLALEEEVERRPFQAVVRLEIERDMPDRMRDLLLRELRLERESRASPLAPADIYEVDGLLDLTALREVADLPRPDLRFPPFHARAPLPPDRSMFTLLAEGDVLVHHPYDAFDATVERFFREAADDPDVESIKLTLYRAGGRSAIVDALVRAAGAGKDVAVFVEVKARFEEARNIEWAKTLERAGIHVVYGLVELKTHAKVALVARREEGGVRRYVHIGTGNYNAATAHLYTDLGLLSADPELAADLGDLFNELTGSSKAPQAAYRRILVAPTYLLPRCIELIDREAAHARAGRGGRIRVKLNGLADAEIIAALYRASQAGVDVALIVRGICCLRPGVPGLSERIRVRSILGRFLEHARIFAFDNGGTPEYYIGSADWRPRNLRRRVEVVAPVRDPAACARLDAILETELADPAAWELEPDGSYAKAGEGGRGRGEG
jgi:polyphosphate kinase